jgi:hypothetical protein
MDRFGTDLFGEDLLDAATHKAVFGGLPSSLSHSLRTAEVGDLVLQLLDAGWRRGQIAARVEALPAAQDPVAEVTALLRSLREDLAPDARWREEKAQRVTAVARARAEQEQPASEESRQQWVAQIRAELSRPRVVQPSRVLRVRPCCALCGEESSFFVTREVRLCDTCVGLLAQGGVRLAAGDGEPGQERAG